jgi:NTE family protein
MSMTMSASTNENQNGKKKIGLVLQGGGALGAFEAGAIKALYARNFECVIVSGASIGAINAVALAGSKETDPAAALETLWIELTVDPPIPFVPSVIKQWWAQIFGNPHMFVPRLDYWDFTHWTHACDTTPIRKTLNSLIDWQQLGDPAHMRVIVSASNVKTGGCEYFQNFDPLTFAPTRLDLERILASGSVPGSFPWTVVNGNYFWDGGLTDNTPLKPVIDGLRPGEAETLPILEIDCNVSAAPLPTNLQQVIFRALEMFLQNKLKTDHARSVRYGQFMRLVRRLEAQLPEQARAELHQDADWKAIAELELVQNIYRIEIRKPGDTGQPAEDNPGDFSRESIERRFTAGRTAMNAFLDLHPTLGTATGERELAGAAKT